MHTLLPGYGPHIPFQTAARYPDPAVELLHPSFAALRLYSASIEQLASGCRWAEGPQWFADHGCLLWSDIPNNRILRWDAATGTVTPFRQPSHNANGLARDPQGRLLACEHLTRRVTRTEYDGSITVLADRWQGKRLNSPNDAVVHPDGSVWFTDPMYGINGNYEGFKAESELPVAVYRVDPQNAQVVKVTDEFGGPNGLCFSPDYKLLYIADTGGPREIKVFDVEGRTLRRGRTFARLDSQAFGPAAGDGIRCDADGNIWAGARPGVQVVAPSGERIGVIRLPENCANVCFGGTKRNRLFMTASQSLYAVYVNVTGAHIA